MKLRNLLLLGAGIAVLALFRGCAPAVQEPLSPDGTWAGFDRYAKLLQDWENADYQVLKVTEEGVGLKVSLMAVDRPSQGPQARVATLNALYALQAVIGKQVSVSVWLFGSEQRHRSDLLGMAYYRVLTEQTVYKSPEEIP